MNQIHISLVSKPHSMRLFAFNLPIYPWPVELNIPERELWMLLLCVTHLIEQILNSNCVWFFFLLLLFRSFFRIDFNSLLVAHDNDMHACTLMPKYIEMCVSARASGRAHVPFALRFLIRNTSLSSFTCLFSNLVRSFKVKSIFGCHIFTEHATARAMLRRCQRWMKFRIKLYALTKQWHTPYHRLSWANT